MTERTTAPTWYWIIAIVAFLWNLVGAFVYLLQVTASPESIESLGEAERDLMLSTPIWVTAAFAIAVWGGTIGTFLLILRKSLAVPVLIISLLGILVQLYGNLVVMDSLEVYGPVALLMPVLVLLVAVFLIWFSRNARTNNWTN